MYTSDASGSEGWLQSITRKNAEKSSGNIISYALFIYIIPTIRNYHGKYWNKKTPLIHIERLYIKIIGHSINVYKSKIKLKKIKENQQPPRNLQFLSPRQWNFHLETTPLWATQWPSWALPALSESWPPQPDMDDGWSTGKHTKSYWTL